MTKQLTRTENRPCLVDAYERGLLYREHLLATGRPLRCEECRTYLKDAVRLRPLSKIDQGFQIADKLAKELSTTREAMRRDAHFSAAVDTITLYCGDQAHVLILRGHEYLDQRTVEQISRTSPERQQHAMGRLAEGLRPLDTEGKGCPVYDTVDHKEILSRLRRAQGKLAVCLTGMPRLQTEPGAEEIANLVRKKLREILADVRALLASMHGALEGVACPCDLARKSQSRKQPERKRIIPSTLKAVLGLLNQTRGFTHKNAKDLPELLLTVSPIRKEKEEIDRRGQVSIRLANQILQAIE